MTVFTALVDEIETLLGSGEKARMRDVHIRQVPDKGT
jgi:hypothetical protein